MNRKNKALAILAAAAAMICAVSCGSGEEAKHAVTTSAFSTTGSETTAPETTLPETTDSAEATENPVTTNAADLSTGTVIRTFQNKPLSLSADFQLPELIGLPLHDAEQQTDTFLTSASYYYGDQSAISLHASLYPVSASNIVQLTSKSEGYLKTDLGSSYETYLCKRENSNGTHTFLLECVAGTYLDGFCRIGFEINPSAGGNDAAAELICETIARTLKIDGNETSIRTSDGFLFGIGNIGTADKITLAGTEYKINPALQTDSIGAKVHFLANGLNYSVCTAGCTAKSAYDALKQADYKETTLAGKPAKVHTEYSAGSGITMTANLLYSENQAIKIILSTENLNSQTVLTDAEAFSAKLSEMMNSSNKAKTEKELTGYINAFCTALRFEESTPAVTEPAYSTPKTTMTTMTTTVFYRTTTTTVTTTTIEEEPPSRPQTVQTTAAPSASNLPMDITKPFRGRSEIALSGKGYVFAKSGLRLRDKPSTSANQISMISFGETVDITALAVSGNSYADNTRWYRINADGKTGYVSADYVAAKFSQTLSDLSDLQLGAMVNFLYCQHNTLFPIFTSRGGFSGSVDSSDSIDGFQRVLPDSLTTAQICDEFYQYFAKYYHRNELTQEPDSGHTVFYREIDGKLYTAAPDTGDSWIDRQRPEDIEALSDSEITVFVRHFLKKHRPADPDAYITYEFSLYYEDGCWKAGKSDTPYSSFTRT